MGKRMPAQVVQLEHGKTVGLICYRFLDVFRMFVERLLTDRG